MSWFSTDIALACIPDPASAMIRRSPRLRLVLIMRKLLILITLPATLVSAGCSSVGEGVGSLTDAIPNALDRAPFVYRPTIQQGNVVTQEQINELQPGMSKRQVRFLLGTPMLTDVFHADRWDFVFTIGEGSRPSEISRVTLLFEDDRLAAIQGDLRPQPEEERVEKKKEILVSVPDWEPQEKSLWRRLTGSVGLEPAD
jgi:outer membrane protein assembly factor BamE